MVVVCLTQCCPSTSPCSDAGWTNRACHPASSGPSGWPAARRTSWCASTGAAPDTCCAAARGTCAPRSNEVLRREMRVLAALAGTDVPHPGLIAGCPDEAVLGGVVFYLMEPVDGFNPSVGLPELHASTRRGATPWGSRRSTPSPRSARSTTRRSAWATSASRTDSWSGRCPAGSANWRPTPSSTATRARHPRPRRRRRLARAQPAGVVQPGILHGDYHLANLMSATTARGGGHRRLGDVHGRRSAARPRVAARDVAERAATAASPAPSAQPADCRPPTSWWPATPSAARDLSAIDWYKVLACFKLGIVLEGTHARAFAGKAPKAIGDMLHATTLGLFPAPSSASVAA